MSTPKARRHCHRCGYTEAYPRPIPIGPHGRLSHEPLPRHQHDPPSCRPRSPHRRQWLAHGEGRGGAHPNEEVLLCVDMACTSLRIVGQCVVHPVLDGHCCCCGVWEVDIGVRLRTPHPTVITHTGTHWQSDTHCHTQHPHVVQGYRRRRLRTRTNHNSGLNVDEDRQ